MEQRNTEVELSESQVTLQVCVLRWSTIYIGGYCKTTLVKQEERD